MDTRSRRRAGDGRDFEVPSWVAGETAGRRPASSPATAASSRPDPHGTPHTDATTASRVAAGARDDAACAAPRRVRAAGPPQRRTGPRPARATLAADHHPVPARLRPRDGLQRLDRHGLLQPPADLLLARTSARLRRARRRGHARPVARRLRVVAARRRVARGGGADLTLPGARPRYRQRDQRRPALDHRQRFHRSRPASSPSWRRSRWSPGSSSRSPTSSGTGAASRAWSASVSCRPPS